MQDFIEQPCVKALLNYQQADEDGIVVLTSRQAIHETVELLKALQARMIQEFESMIPEEVDYLTHMENKTAYDRGNGFNECRSIILNNLKK
jgi:hypothetical protein